ncbi:MAG: Wzz/FepE/Etk N-terminal domain-containing protein [Atribacterota bacterium]|nr:Wzz/FepE/Etk N-terminal domain-containing protein [Atribacterota bacterium]MDD3641749.1 Wzz/FepE/Etk N-terminal domain-containing protein [Atribacterota bacterium]MDD4765677.1 Wzz/FepE/Etk N-terminal domain-containing protein [Atribacterota bacterium]MDD5636075.1 Wzz/FepE/Etk N-terminal domain-containing protein [Atribacterota bacterium]
MPEEEIDLRELINVLIKRKWLIIGIFIIAVLVAGIVSYFMLEPVYKTASTITVNQPENKSSLITYYSAEQYRDLIFDQEIEGLVIKSLQLDKSPYNLDIFDLEKNISAKVADNNIEVSYSFREPSTAQNILNQWIELFVKKQNTQYLEELENTYNFTAEQFNQSEKEFLLIEKDKIESDIANNMTVLTDKLKKNRTVTESQNARLAEIELLLKKYQADLELKEKSMQEQEKIIKLKRLLNGEQYFQELLSQLSDSEKNENIQMWYEIEERNPLYYDLYKEILNLSSDIKKLEIEKEQIVLDLNAININEETLNKELVEATLKETYLSREYNEALEEYNDLSKKYQEIELAYQSKADMLEIKKPAYKPNAPIKPNKKLNIAIGGVLGLFMGIFIAFFIEFWQNSSK